MKKNAKKAMIIAGGVALSVATGIAINVIKKMKNKKNMMMEEI